MNNYYDLLGITKIATLQEIKTAYKKNALKFHPDRSAINLQGAKEAEERFKLINEAYQVLSDPFKRAMYDSQLEFEDAKKLNYYKQYTSNGDYSSTNPNSESSQNGTGYTYQRRQADTKKQPIFVFGKTELYIILGFAAMFVLVYFFMKIMTNYSYNNYIEQAKAAIELGDFVEANRALKEAEIQKRKDAEINYLFGKIELDYQKNYNEALEFFQNAIAYADSDDKESKTKYYTAKADTYFLMNEYYKAIEEYKMVNSLGGYNQKVIMNIADLYLEKLKDYDKASLYFDKIIEKEPKLVEAYIGKAVAKLQLKDYLAMGQLLDKALKINPENPYLWYYNGFYLWEKPILNTENAEEIKAKDKENACESWKLAANYGSEEAQKPLREYCK